jgi:Uncharacterized protein conserved in bacteria
MSQIHFDVTLTPRGEDGPGVLITLPEEASAKLPSRGLVVVEGTLGAAPFTAVLEPDGNKSHWFLVSAAALDAAGAGVGDTVAVTMAPSKTCPEPRVPADLAAVLAADPAAQAIWRDITPLARWDWIRWIGAAKQPETRKRRVDSVCSRLHAGKRRPCCFDRSQCTLTDA